MANVDLGTDKDVTDKRKTAGSLTQPLATPANYADVAALRTRLNAISSTTYSADRLNAMTKNDMIYAVRLNDDAAGI